MPTFREHARKTLTRQRIRRACGVVVARERRAAKSNVTGGRAIRPRGNVFRGRFIVTFDS